MENLIHEEFGRDPRGCAKVAAEMRLVKGAQAFDLRWLRTSASARIRMESAEFCA